MSALTQILVIAVIIFLMFGVSRVLNRSYMKSVTKDILVVQSYLVGAIICAMAIW